jgi:RNA polymerase sigma-70 factor (ECF subfamily)
MEKGQFMQACREGGVKIEAALRGLHRDYGGALLHEGVRCLGDVDTARDVVQETLLKAWRRCGTFRGESELFPWLRNILRHAAIDWLRQRRPEQPLADAEGRTLPEVEVALRALRGDLAGEPEPWLQGAQLEACFRTCAARFATEQPLAAAVVRWVSKDDLTHVQIAELLQRSPGATREYISQCRKKARVYFRDWYLLVREQAGGAVE